MQSESGSWPATAQGLAAIGLWGTLAPLSALSGAIPPFQLTATSFAIATVIGAAYMLLAGQGLRVFRSVPLASWVFSVYGLLGFHAVYFLAIKTAPPVEVTVINYLWPLLIVLFSGLLPVAKGGSRLRWWHIAGAALGFAGAALVPMASGAELDMSGSAIGYGAALASALIWSSYSVGSRLFDKVPTVALTGTCALTALGALAGHVLFERTVWPLTSTQVIVSVALGLGPVGIAFFLWDAGMKRGRLRLLGVMSYLTPLLSTGLLVAFGLGQGGPMIWASVVLVIAGALLAASDTFSQTPRSAA